MPDTAQRHLRTHLHSSMRFTACLVALLVGSFAQAQTYTSVQDGDWNDPATWDCSCVPLVNDVVVIHAVQITTNMMLPMQELHVTSSGMLTMDAPHNIAMTEAVINDGYMELLGIIDVDGEIYNNNQIDVAGAFLSHGLLMMGGAGTLLTTTDWENGGTTDGQGWICVSGYSANYGTIQGQIDVCDATPTTATPPILDYNDGVVAPTVTFCLEGPCSVDVRENDELTGINAWPVPADRSITLGELPQGGCTIELREATGRIVQPSRVHEGSRATIEVQDLRPGTYHLIVSTPISRRSMSIAVVR